MPYIDVADLQELPLALLGRFPEKMTKDIINKIGANEDLFKVGNIVGHWRFEVSSGQYGDTSSL